MSDRLTSPEWDDARTRFEIDVPKFFKLASQLSQIVDDEDDYAVIRAISEFHANISNLRTKYDFDAVVGVIDSLTRVLVEVPGSRFLGHRNDLSTLTQRKILLNEAHALRGAHSIFLEEWVPSIARKNASALRAVTPAQAIGPAQFALDSGKLVIAPARSSSDEETEEATQAAWDMLTELGEGLLRSLETSNCDPRLIRTVSQLHKLVASKENVIRLGLLNSGLSDTIALLEGELAGSVTLDLRTYSNGIRMYVGQFDDWSKFLENSVNAELTSEDGAALAAAADKVVHACTEQPEFADPEVPKTIIAIRELLNDPAKAGKRAIFAMMRTLENLCVVAFDHIAGTADDTVKAARKTFSKAAGAAIGGVLLVIAAQAAGALGPIGARVQELKWVDQGLELAKKLTPKE